MSEAQTEKQPVDPAAPGESVENAGVAASVSPIAIAATPAKLRLFISTPSVLLLLGHAQPSGLEPHPRTLPLGQEASVKACGKTVSAASRVAVVLSLSLRHEHFMRAGFELGMIEGHGTRLESSL